MNQPMHPTVVLIKLRPEPPHIALVSPSSWLRVVPVQGIRNKVCRLESSRRAGISEHRDIGEISQRPKRATGDSPLIRPTLKSPFDAAAVMDDEPSLLMATAAHAVDEVIEFLDQEFICSKSPMIRVPFHNSADETPRQVGIDGGESG